MTEQSAPKCKHLLVRSALHAYFYVLSISGDRAAARPQANLREFRLAEIRVRVAIVWRAVCVIVKSTRVMCRFVGSYMTDICT